MTREPGGTPGAERIRSLLVEGEAGDWTPMTEALLNYAARREHVSRVIAPALAAGQWVLSDRFADSTMAYQGFGHGLGRKAIEALHRAAIGRLAPDLTIVLDIPVREGLARAAARRGREDRYENMAVGFHERVRRGFRAIARGEPRRCALLDARLPPEALQEEIRRVVARRLARALGR
jgi:dTMP kinase